MKTQAWGWLATAVLAAGLNASYHDGGLQWAHQVADQVRYNSGAVLALAAGDANQFLHEARILTARNQASPCPFATALARVETSMAGSETELARFETMSAREEAALARMEASRARMEADVERIRIPAVAFNQSLMPSPRISLCPRVRIHVPRVNVPAPPLVNVSVSATGPV